MSARSKPRERVSLRAFPKVGDFVLIGHGIWSEPDQWWISQCEWSDGESFLVRSTMGSHPTYAPYLGEASAIMAIGTDEQCRAVARAARDIRFNHIERFREAYVTLEGIKEACVEEIIDAVAALPGGQQAAGRIM